MSRERKYRDVSDLDWPITQNDNNTFPIDEVKLILLMDIREELKRLRSALAPLRHLECGNFLAIPGKLDAILKTSLRTARNTTKKRRVRK